jgi:MFS family permease
MIALRALQALGGGAFMPSATGIVSDHFGADRDRAIGMFTSIFPIRAAELGAGLLGIRSSASGCSASAASRR